MAVAARTATRATRIEEPASIDMWAGPADGTSARRLDIEVKPAEASGLQVG
jgi:hypothetical protein